MFNERWFIILSDLFVNLAAGWFGIILIGPALANISSFIDILWLLSNVIIGIICLLLAYKLRTFYE